MQTADVDIAIRRSGINLVGLPIQVAYKNVIGARRASWRIISSIEQKEESKGNDEHVKRIKSYREVVSAIASLCSVLLPLADDDASSYSYCTRIHTVYVQTAMLRPPRIGWGTVLSMAEASCVLSHVSLPWSAHCFMCCSTDRIPADFHPRSRRAKG